jgi:hypothetical protein
MRWVGLFGHCMFANIKGAFGSLRRVELGLLIGFLGCIQNVARTHVKAPSTQAPGDTSESSVSTESPSSLAPVSQKRSTPARVAATMEMARAPARRRKRGQEDSVTSRRDRPSISTPSSHHLVRNRHFSSSSSLLPRARKVSRWCWRRRRRRRLRLRLRPLLRQGFTFVHLQP